MKFNPTIINSHSGCDHWSLKESVEFFTRCVKFEKDLPVKVCHETHRRRAFYTPFSTAAILEKVPDINVNLDLSHWTPGCERLFNKEPWWPKLLKTLKERCLMFDARIGSE